MSEFERLFTIAAAYDKRHSDPEKNYGIHGVEMRWVVKKPGEGAVQFLLYTGWHLPEVFGVGAEDPIGLSIMQQYREGFEDQRYSAPMPADLGYHSPRPIYDEQSPMEGDCDFVEGGRCYYDGSSLNAWRPFEVMLRGGDEALWEFLEDYYRSTFT